MDKKEQLTQIVKTVQKDIGQFELLYSQIINKVYYWCYNIVNDEATAKDLAQESMVRIYQKLQTLDNAEAFHSWMYILVRNVCYKYLRSNKKNVQFLESDSYSEDFEETIAEQRIDNLPSEAFDLKETKKIVLGFVDELTKKQKEVIMLFYLEEFKITEISEMLKCNEGTVKVHLHYGRKSLEEKINNYQKTNNIKLYSSMLFPILGTILHEQENELSNEIDLGYDKKTFKSSRFLKSSKIISTLSSNAIITVSAIVITSVILMTVVVLMKTNSNTDMMSNKPLENTIEMKKKIEGNPYIESITSNTFPMRDSTVVSIHLKKDISDKSIKITINNDENDEVLFEESENELIINAKQNGEYVVTIENTEFSFNVDTIDEKAPELDSIQNYGNYIQLNISDELSQVNYDLSYVEFKGEKYMISNDLKVYGLIKGEIIVSIHINEESYRKYYIEVY